jgi:hypothetical protein
VAALFGGGLWWVMTGGPVSLFEACESTAGDETVRLDLEQAEVAATITAAAERRNLPARAVSIALAAGKQESGLRNLDYGDRDSLGVFQQRPSQGWGTPRQVTNPAYAANRFYDALLNVPQWQGITINDAAQSVQRSDFPNHYAKHEAAARSIASALTGYSPATFSCVVRHSPMAAQQVGRNGLTPRAAQVGRLTERGLGTAVVGVAAADAAQTASPGGVGGLAAEQGRALTIAPAGAGQERIRAGWMIAHWLVAHADTWGVERISFDDRTWQAGRSRHGWEDYPQGSDSKAVRVEVVAGD